MEEYIIKLLESGLFSTAEEIYSATLPELSALLKGKQERIRQEVRMRNIYAGTITAAIYNIMRGKGKSVLKWDDIFKDQGSGASESNQCLEPMDPLTAYQIFKAAFGGGSA